MSSQAQRRAEQKRERREAILDAAESVFGARGAAKSVGLEPERCEAIPGRSVASRAA